MVKGRGKNDKGLWIKSGACILVGVSVIGSVGVWLKTKHPKIKEPIEEVAKQLFDYHLNRVMDQTKKENIDWRYQITKLEVIQRTTKEYSIKIYYDLILDDEYEREYTSEQWMMRIQKVNGKGYEVIEQGEQLEEGV